MTDRHADVDNVQKLGPSLEAVLDGIDREELVRLTRELVRIPSVYRPEDPDGNEYRAATSVDRKSVV